MPQRRNYDDTEFDLLRNAMYTDPNDQSVWMYHRWLVGTGENGHLSDLDNGVNYAVCSGRNKDLLLREIASIQELLQEQPDSRCESAFYCLCIPDLGCAIGCLESIVHYQQLLVKNWSLETDVKQMSEDCISLLKRLEELDPMRKMRYQEQGERTGGSWIRRRN